MQEITNKQEKELELRGRIIAAAIADLEMVGSCKTCGNRDSFCESNPDSCNGYEWRGVPDLSMTKAELYEHTIRLDFPPEKPMSEKSYVELLSDFRKAIASDEAMPDADKLIVMEKLWALMELMWKYSD